MTEIGMPRLSDSMEEGVIVRWLVEPGQAVSPGEDLVEIETDKATMTYQAEAEGVLEVLVPAGEAADVGVPIARLNGDGDAAPAPPADSERPSAVTAAEDGGDSDGRVLASPLARRVARERGVDLGGLSGSGPRGRVTKADVLAAAEGPPAAPRPAAPEPAPAESPVDGARGGSVLVEPTSLQRTIARRMAEAKAIAPDFQVETEVTMDEAMELRAALKRIAAEGEPVPSLNDMVVKACALALRDHPRANASYTDEGFELHREINVGLAVASEDALMVPTIAGADQLSLGEIAAASRRLAERVHSGEITPPELAGGTFTVSNLGMLGVTAVTPVINRGQAAILGVGATRETLARVDGEIVDRTLMTLRLSCDHRILYGADGARFLADVRALLEVPMRMAL